MTMTESRNDKNIKKEGTFRNTLVSELPRIDAALKSYCSWYAVAGGVSAADDDNGVGNNITINEALTLTRRLSLSINRHVFPVGEMTRNSSSSQHEYLVCSKVWNEIITAKQKPTKWLGKTALRLAWKDLEFTESLSLAKTKNENGNGNSSHDDNGNDEINKNETFAEFVKHFENLLFAEDNNDTASLIWNYSEAELSRRATERKETASKRLQEEQENLAKVVHESHVSGPIIEELTEEDE